MPGTPLLHRRRLLTAGLAAVLLVAGALALRRPAAAWLLGRALAASGIALDRVEVADLTFYRADLSRVSVEGGVVVAGRVILHYHPRGLIAGRIDRVELEDADLRIGGGGAPPGAPDALAGRTLHDALARLGEITVRHGRLLLDPLAIRVSGTFRPRAPDEVHAALAYQVDSDALGLAGDLDVILGSAGEVRASVRIHDGRLGRGSSEVCGLAGAALLRWRQGLPDLLKLDLTAGDVAGEGIDLSLSRVAVDLTDGRLVADVDLRARDGSQALAVRARASGVTEHTDLELDLSADIAFPAALPLPAGFPPPDRGRACVDLTVRGSLDLAGVDEDRLEPSLREATGGGSAGLAVELEGVGIPGHAAGVSGRVQLDAWLESGAIAYVLADGSSLRAARLDPGWLARTGVPANLQGWLASGIVVEGAARARVESATADPLVEIALAQLTLRGADPGAGAGVASLALAGEAAGRRGGLGGRLRLDARLPRLEAAAVHATGVTLALPLDFSLSDRLRLGLAAPGQVQVATLDAPAAAARLEAPLVLRIGRGLLELARDGSGVLVGRHQLELGVEDELKLRVGEGSVALRLPSVELSGGGVESIATPRIAIAGAALTLPGLDLALADVAAEIDLGAPAGSVLARLAAGSLRHRAEPPRFAPPRLDLTLVRQGEDLVASGTASYPGHSGLVRVSGRYRGGDGSGEALLEADPIEFVPGALQPEDLIPGLAGFSSVRGRAGLSAWLAWGAGTTASGARIRLDQVALTAGDLGVAGLSLDLELDSLAPIRSRPGQCLVISRIEPAFGPPLSGLAADLAVAGDAGGMRVAIAEVEAGFAGGTLSAGPIELATGGETALAIRVAGLDLAEVLRWAAIDGLSGEGRFDGIVPLVLEGEDLVVAGGRLAGQGPGVLRYRSARAREVLAGAGQAADLMAQALEDFHYTELDLTLSHSAAADTRVKVSVLGSNPEVLDGYPFRINVDLAGNTRNLLAALSQSYRLRNQLWMRGLE